MNTRRIFTFSGAGTSAQIFLTAIGALGIPAIILPFAYDYSPLGAAWSQDLFLSDLWRISWPFFLPVLITTAIVRWMFLKKHSQAEIITSYMVSVAMLCVTFSGYVGSYNWTDDVNSEIAFTAPFIILFFGCFVVLKNRKKLIPKPGGGIISLQVAYLTNCALCLIGFIDNWQIAAYFSLVVAIAYLAQIILFLGDKIPDKSASAS